MPALFWGAVAGSAVLLGALISLFFHIKKKWIAIIMAFGTGVLMGAAILELLQEAVRSGGLFISILGVLAGGLVFTIADLLIHRKGGGERKRSEKNPENHSGIAIFIGTILDAIPESIIIGTGLLEGTGVSLVMLTAIFIRIFQKACLVHQD